VQNLGFLLKNAFMSLLEKQVQVQITPFGAGHHTAIVMYIIACTVARIQVQIIQRRCPQRKK
jgi:hypothetical protein